MLTEFSRLAEASTINPAGKTDTTTEEMTRTTNDEVECSPGFTNWFNIHHPDASGEYENVQDIRQAGYIFCSNNYITAMECRVHGTGMSHHQSDEQGVTCNFLVGLYCENKRQHSNKKCLDYEVRFFCDCGRGEREGGPNPPKYVTSLKYRNNNLLWHR